MTNASLANTLVIIVLCFDFAYLLIFYFLVMSDIRILTNAKKVGDLDKWALKYVKKNKLNNDIILENLTKQIESGKKNIKILKFCCLLIIIFVIVHFASRDPYTVHILWKTIQIGHDQLMILNGIMILCLISISWLFFVCKLIHKRNIVAYEQFSRIFKEENNSQNNVTSQ